MRAALSVLPRERTIDDEHEPATGDGDVASRRPGGQEYYTMFVAADYPFMDVLWTMLIFFAWVVWIWMMIVILTDVFRRRDVGGVKKAVWCIFLIILPFVGVLSYLIANHDKMAERNVAAAEKQQKQMDEYIRNVATNDTAASEIEKGAELLRSGAISEAEYEQLKSRALAAH